MKFQIPNGGPEIVSFIDDLKFIAVDADGTVHGYHMKPKASNCRWVGLRSGPLSILSFEWLDENNWRQCCWEISKERKLGFYLTESGEFIKVVSFNGEGFYPVVCLVKLDYDAWLPRHASFEAFDTWEFLDEDMPK
jgi:hypothetical protein